MIIRGNTDDLRDFIRYATVDYAIHYICADAKDGMITTSATPEEADSVWAFIESNAFSVEGDGSIVFNVDDMKNLFKILPKKENFEMTIKDESAHIVCGPVQMTMELASLTAHQEDMNSSYIPKGDDGERWATALEGGAPAWENQTSWLVNFSSKLKAAAFHDDVNIIVQDGSLDIAVYGDSLSYREAIDVADMEIEYDERYSSMLRTVTSLLSKEQTTMVLGLDEMESGIRWGVAFTFSQPHFHGIYWMTPVVE